MVKGNAPKNGQGRLAQILFGEAVKRADLAAVQRIDLLWAQFTDVLEEVGLRIVLVDQDGQP